MFRFYRVIYYYSFIRHSFLGSKINGSRVFLFDGKDHLLDRCTLKSKYINNLIRLELSRKKSFVNKFRMEWLHII